MKTLQLFAFSFIAVLFVFTVNIPATAQQRALSVESVTAKPGESVPVSISIDDATGIAAIQLSLSFDSNIVAIQNQEDIQLTDLTQNKFALTTNFPQAGKAIIGMVSSSGRGLEGGSGAIVTINFKINATAEADAKAALQLQNVILADEKGKEITTKLENGMITVTDGNGIQPERILSVGSGEAKSGEEVSVPISIDDATGIAAIQLTLSFDSNIVTIQEDIQLTALTQNKFALTPSFPEEGKAIIGMVSSTGKGLPAGSSGDILIITFKVKDTAKDSDKSALHLSGVIASDEKGKEIPVKLNDGLVGPPISERTLAVGSAEKAQPKEEVPIPVSLDNATSMAAIQFTLTYDVKIVTIQKEEDIQLAELTKGFPRRLISKKTR